MFNKKKNKVEWTDKTAPKEGKLHLEFKIRLIKGKSDGYYTADSTEIGLFEGKESFISNSDSSRESIKEEITQRFEELYTKICMLLDSNTTDFSEGYWKDKQIKEEETNLTL